MGKNKLSDFINHMEYLGYEFEEYPDEKNTMVGGNGRFGPIWVRNGGGPTIIRTIIELDSSAKKQPLKFLYLVNQLNMSGRVAQYISHDDTLLIVAIYSGPYDKKNFGEFIDALHADILMAFELEGIEQFKKAS